MVSEARVWYRAARLKFLPQGVLPVVLGTAVAYRGSGVLDLPGFLLALIGMALVQVGLTVLNDAVDYREGTDRSGLEEKNPYSGGSGVFVEGLLTPKEALRGVAAMYVVAVSIGLYLTWLHGVELLVIGLAGVAISVAYSAPPLKLAYRGWGELAMLVGYGPVITAGAFFVQTSSVTVESLAVGLVPGGLMFCMILLNEVPDREEDLAAGKLNFVARFGPGAGVAVQGTALVGLYLGVAAGAATGFFPRASLLVLLSAPLGLSSTWRAWRSLEGEGFESANRLMVATYSSTVLLFTAGYLL